MKRHKFDQNDSVPNFIGSWIIEPPTLCVDIKNFYDSHKEKQKQGRVSQGKIDRSIKDSTDISIEPRNISSSDNNAFKIYLNELSDCYKDYANQWPFLKEYYQSVDVGIFNLQRYESGQHFNKIHTERSFEHMEREFAFMTYLNEGMEGGSTYFQHYDLEIKPVQGLTLIWPAAWTHAHKGNIVKTGTKYIITGWLDLH